jgi:hypothetical protein
MSINQNSWSESFRQVKINQKQLEIDEKAVFILFPGLFLTD